MMSENVVVRTCISAICWFTFVLFVASSVHAQVAPRPQEDSQKAGNNPPLLSGNPKIFKGGQPREGYSGDTFRFGFDYQDPDGDPCVRCEVWIDHNQNGIFEESEKHTLEEQERRGPKSDYTPYETSLPIYNQTTDVEVTFRFFASDGKDVAKDYSLFLQPQSVKVMPRFVARSESVAVEKESIAGQTFVLEVSLLVHFALFPDAMLDWDRFVKDTDFGDASLVDYSVRESYFNEDYDQVTARLMLRADADASGGRHAVSFPSLHASFITNDSTEEITWEKGASYTIRPYLVSEPHIWRKAAFIGEPFLYEFSVLVGAGRDPDDVAPFEPEQITMHPFSVVDVHKETTKTPSGVHRLDYTLKLALFGVPGEYNIPPLRTRTLDLSEIAFTLSSADPPAVVPENESEMVALLGEIRSLASAPVVTKPSSYVDGTYLVRIALALCVVTLLTVIGFGVVKLRGGARVARHAETMEELQRRFEFAEAHLDDSSPETYMETYHALRALVFARAGMRDSVGRCASELMEGEEYEALRAAVSHDVLAKLAYYEERYFKIAEKV